MCVSQQFVLHAFTLTGTRASARSGADWYNCEQRVTLVFKHVVLSLVLANSILQELSWAHNKSSSCSPWSGCGQGETYSCVPLRQALSLRHGLSPEVEVLCAEHKHRGSAKPKRGQRQKQRRKKKLDCCCLMWHWRHRDPGHSAAEVGTALGASPSQHGAVWQDCSLHSHRAEIYWCLWQHPEVPLGSLWGL